MKTCTKCLVDKPITEFYKRKRKLKDGHSSHCRSCIIKYYKHKYMTSSTHRAICNKSARKWSKNNKDKINASRRARVLNPIARIRKKLCQRIREFATIPNSTRDPICTSIGCSRKDLRVHIESEFQPGMTWENYGEWEIDHIKPLCLFNLLDQKERLAANLYTNLQPLWAKDNLLKGTSYTPTAGSVKPN